jgi:hypothetical protein
MSADLEKRIDRLENLQDRVFAKIDELHVEFVTLASKVGNGLTASTKNHACEIEHLKSEQKKLMDEMALRSKQYEVRHVKLAANLTLLENNLVKDINQLKGAIAQEIREGSEAFIENLRKHRDEERIERTSIEIERRNEIAKLASERKLYIILGAVAVTILAPLVLRMLDSIIVKL